MTEREPKTQIFADSPFSLGNSSIWRAQETADFRRKPQIFAENRRKPQIGSVTLGASPLGRFFKLKMEGGYRAQVLRGCLQAQNSLADVSDIFKFFFCSGEGKGVFGAPCWLAVGFLFIENPRGGVPRRGGLEGVCEGFGGGVNIFFRGRNSHQDSHQAELAAQDF